MGWIHVAYMQTTSNIIREGEIEEYSLIAILNFLFRVLSLYSFPEAHMAPPSIAMVAPLTCAPALEVR